MPEASARPLVEVTVDVRFLRRDLTVRASVDMREHMRRERLGRAGKRLGGLDLLRRLASLPLGLSVAEPAWIREVTGGPSVLGPCLDLSRPGFVTRVVAPPADPLAIAVRASRWDSGLRAACVMAQYGPCSVVIRGKEGDIAWVAAQADFWGVGLISAAGNRDPEEIVRPAPHLPRRYSGASWLFAETVYGAAAPGINTMGGSQRRPSL